MEKFNTFKWLCCTVFGFIGGAIANLLGGWTKDVETLVFLMATDFITGVIVAFVFKKSSKTKSGAGSSKACFEGLLRKVAMLICIAVLVKIDSLLGTGYLKNAGVMAFIFNECVSLFENFGKMNVPFAKAFKDGFDMFRDNAEEQITHWFHQKHDEDEQNLTKGGDNSGKKSV